MDKSRYWALENADDVVDKLKGYRDHPLNRNPMEDLWKRAALAYYSNATSGDGTSALEFMGTNGEIIKTSINEARSLIRQYVSLVTKVKLAFEPLLSTSDTGAISDARVGKSLCEFVCTSKNIDNKADKLAESAAVFGIGFIAALWRADLGEDYTVDNGNIIKTGDVWIGNISPYDVFFDFRHESFEELEHVEFRVKRNRYSIYSLFNKPEILDVDSAKREKEQNDGDSIFVYYWFHKPTPTLPNGRMIVSLEDGTVLVDDVNHYECLPIVACIPETFQSDIIYGYPKILDLLPLQESFDTVFSAVTSNLCALGLQMIASPEGNGINVKDIGGLQFLTYNPVQAAGGGKPEGVNLVQQAPDAYKYTDNCRMYMTELSGLNGALRGAPPPGVTSGVALATLAANALEFIAPFSKAWQKAMQDLMTLVIKTYAKFAKVPKQIPIAGKNNQTIVRDFIGKDLANIKQVQFQISNPQQLTIGGRIALAESLLSNGLVKDANSYLELVFSGSIEGVVEGPLDHMHLIRSENDDLSVGTKVLALTTDLHAQHVLHHVELLSDPELRRKAASGSEVEKNIVSAIMEHIIEHKNLLSSADPTIRAIVETGQAPSAPPPSPAPSPNAIQEQPQLAANPAEPLPVGV